MIDDCIVELHKDLKNANSEIIFGSAIYRRLLILSFIANISEINRKLKELSEKLNSTIDHEAIEIDYELYLKDAYWANCWILDEYDCPDIEADDKCIEEIADYLPCVGKDQTMTPESVESFKTGLRLLCDINNMSEGDAKYALHNCFKKMKLLLIEVRDKSKRAEASMYAKFWDDTYAFYNKEQVLAKYNNWKDEIGDLDFAKLKDKQIQELVKVLTSGFLYFRPMPTNGEINRCKLVIDEDSLVAGYVLPDNIKELCARFEFFMSWKDKEQNIIALDYIKLGKYLYEHHAPIWVKSADIIKFDILLDAIQEDMAKSRPELSKYLKGYEEDYLKYILEKVLPIIDTCKSYLNESVSEDFLSNYIKSLLNGELKQDYQTKLSSKAVFTHLCKMLGMLKASAKVFKDRTTSDKLAACLAELTNKPNKDSMKRKIDEGAADKESDLYIWTDAYIKEHCLIKRE